MAPKVVVESLVHRFKFWADGQIQEGMRDGQELYKLIGTFPLEKRQQVYGLGFDLSEHGQQVVITKSSSEYALWVTLRSVTPAQNASTPQPQLASSEGLAIVSDPNHPAIGKHYRLASTNHPQASVYQGEECRIIEVWRRYNSQFMLAVQFADGVEVRGLFCTDIENLDGSAVKWQDLAWEMFPRTAVSV